MNLPRENKNSVFYALLVIIVVGASIFGLLFAIGVEKTGFIMLPLAVVFTIFSMGLLYLSASKTVASEDEITSKTMFSAKTLKWSEVARVSGSGHAIKLHNSDGDVTIAISPRVPGYQEIVEWLGAKRPDLFNQQEYSRVRVNLLSILMRLFGGLSLIIIGILPFILGDYSREVMISFIITILVGVYIIGAALFAPWAVSIQGKSIEIGYLFTHKTLTVHDVSSVYFGYSQTRRGRRNYYVQISKREGSVVRFSSLKPSMPIAYLIFKNWYTQSTQINPAIQPN